MTDEQIIARVEEDPQNPDIQIISSPLVGMADHLPEVGRVLVRSERVARVAVLGRSYDVLLPHAVQGRVVEHYISADLTPVMYGSPLLKLDANFVSGSAGTGGAASSDDATGRSDGGTIAVTSPTEGIFYRRPTPDSPPYVEVGTPVKPGSVLGLVEVMKCFNKVVYSGTDVPQSGKITEICVEDSAEVKFGQTLFTVTPE